ncbi:HypC/HybG/HupF family hydrogenase formation chaperone [Methanobrevibacter sp. OttesenSCG-928-K11]|nr:HypC/HybG/HupF family hydrogenase formation chaperone [Methanobrevibacter sp. OttesenSCG-928-K11]MDL2270984.1 HypC/HybG/HupF family hydrogenase formation chaperone [Methanobrevibacter sp. OttesenSCG-928-I08]
MCIAAPAKVIEINKEENRVVADFGGVRQEAKLNLLDDIELGDHILIHAGYAIEKLSEEAAKESLEAWDELLKVLDEEDEELAELNKE